MEYHFGHTLESLLFIELQRRRAAVKMYARNSSRAQIGKELLRQLGSDSRSAPIRLDIHMQMGRIVLPEFSDESSRKEPLRGLFEPQTLLCKPPCVSIAWITTSNNIG